jgi:hypothetical protein
MEEKMKKTLLRLALGLFLILVFVIQAGGEETKPDPGPEAATERKPAASLGEIEKAAEGIKNLLGLSVYLQGGYTFNLENPDSGINRQRVFDKDANTFLLDLAQIQLTRNAPIGGLGYKFKVSFGETAKSIHSAGLGDPNDAVDLTEAYMDYVAPLGSGIKLRFGKFVTYHSAEVIEARDDYNYSRSFLFNYAVPFTHTGLMAEYTFSKAFTAGAFLVNGWDVAKDNNKGKTFGARFAVTPVEPLSFNFNFMYGPEQPDNSSHDRFLFDWVAAFSPTKKLTLMVNVDYAREEKDPLTKGKNSEWYGVAGYVKYDFTDWFSTSIRAEYFNDKDGVRTGIAQKLKEITITPEFKIVKNLLLRPEYRHDWSSKDAFDSKSAVFRKKSQDTIAVGVMYTW